MQPPVPCRRRLAADVDRLDEVQSTLMRAESSSQSGTKSGLEPVFVFGNQRIDGCLGQIPLPHTLFKLASDARPRRYCKWRTIIDYHLPDILCQLFADRTFRRGRVKDRVERVQQRETLRTAPSGDGVPSRRDRVASDAVKVVIGCARLWKYIAKTFAFQCIKDRIDKTYILAEHRI
jgi:hypothetical protein